MLDWSIGILKTNIPNYLVNLEHLIISSESYELSIRMGMREYCLRHIVVCACLFIDVHVTLSSLDIGDISIDIFLLLL